MTGRLHRLPVKPPRVFAGLPLLARSTVLCALIGIATPSCRANPKESGLPAAQDTMTNVLVALAIEQLTSSNPAAVEQIMNCEVTRLYHEVGSDSADKLLKVADARIEANSTRAQRSRVRDSLSLKFFVFGQGCDTLAAAGRLGGPFPHNLVPARLPGDTFW